MGLLRGGFTGVLLVILLIVFLFLGAPLLCKSIPKNSPTTVDQLDKIARLEKGDTRKYVVRKIGSGKKVRGTKCWLYPNEDGPTYKLCFTKKKRLSQITRKPNRR